MMRRWRVSAARVRRYAASMRARRTSRAARVPFKYLRRARHRTRDAHLVVHARLGVAVNLHIVRASRRRAVPMPGAARDVARRDTIRHEWSPLPVTHVRTLRGEVPRTRFPRALHVITHERRATTLRHDQQLQRLTSSRLERAFVTRESGWPDDGLPRPVTQPHHDAALQASAARRQPPALANIALAYRTHSRTTRTMGRHPPTARPPASPSARSEQAAPAAPRTATPLPLQVVDHRRIERATAATRAFAAQPQPLAPPAARTPVADAVPIERIERTLRESMTVVAERTVQRELDRTLHPGAPTSRRLRESIQSEMYDDIVFERERRGER